MINVLIKGYMAFFYVIMYMVVVMNNKGYTGKELLILIAIMGIFTMTIIGATSNAYKDNSSDYYSELEHAIEKQAVLYGETLKNLKEEGHLMITLDDMIDAGYFIPDEEGNVVDPRNSKHTLNMVKIKLTYENDKVKAEVIEEK